MQLLTRISPASKEYKGEGGMVAWVPPRQVAEALALAGGEAPAELHLTLCIFPDWKILDSLAVAEALERVSVAFGPLAGALNGLGRFSLAEEDAVVALADVPGLGRLREALAWELRERGQEFSEDHGFAPHITLIYIPAQARLPVQRLEPRDIMIRSLTLFGPDGVVGELALGGAEGWKAGEDEPSRAGPFEEQRLAAEERLRRRVEKALGRLWDNVRRRLRQESRQKSIGDIPDDQIFWEAQRADFLGELAGMPEELLAEGVAQAARLGLAVDFGLVSQSVADLAVDYSNSWWDALDHSTRDRMRTAIQRHIDSGAPLSQLRQDLTPIFGRQRAELIASTEVTRLYAEGNRLGYANAGVEQVEWRTVVDGHVDQECRALHKERMMLGAEEHVPPAHPRCRCWLAPVVEDKPLRAEPTSEEIEDAFNVWATESGNMLELMAGETPTFGLQGQRLSAQQLEEMRRQADLIRSLAQTRHTQRNHFWRGESYGSPEEVRARYLTPEGRPRRDFQFDRLVSSSPDQSVAEVYMRGMEEFEGHGSQVMVEILSSQRRPYGFQGTWASPGDWLSWDEVQASDLAGEFIHAEGSVFRVVSFSEPDAYFPFFRVALQLVK